MIFKCTFIDSFIFIDNLEKSEIFNLELRKDAWVWEFTVNVQGETGI